MSNMSYCRFHNTSLDLQDCIDALDEYIESSGRDRDGDKISRNELSALKEMVNQCEYYIGQAETLLEIIECSEV